MSLNLTRRVMEISAVAVALGASVGVTATGHGTANQEKGTVGNVLTHEEACAIRDAVYAEPFLLMAPKEGKKKFINMVVVPKKLRTVFEKKPIQTLELLLMVVNGGRPEDASAAASYAFSLANGPEIGAVVRMSSRKDLDKISAGQGASYRQLLVVDLQQVIRELAKGNQ